MRKYKTLVLVLLAAAGSGLVFWQIFVSEEDVEKLRFCANSPKSQIRADTVDADTLDHHGVCGYSDREARGIDPQFWSPNKHVVLRSVFWDPRRFKGFHHGRWIFLVEAEKRIVKEKLLVGVQIGNYTYTGMDIHVHKLKVHGYIDKVCKQLTHWYLMLRCNAPFQPNPTHAAVLFKAGRRGCVLSAVSEHPPVLIPHVSQPKPASIVSCLAPAYGNPALLTHWLRYEKATGVSHVHMIGEQSILKALDNPELKSAIQEGFLTVDIWPKWFSMWQIYYNSQLLAYQDCLYRFQGLYEYVFTHDIDDFFVPLHPDHKTLSYYLSRYCPRGTCNFSWEEFQPSNSGLSGPIGEDGNVTDKVVAKHSRVPRFPEHKCIHRIQDLFELGIHEGLEWKEEGFLLKICCYDTLIPRTEAYVAHVRY